MASAAQQPAVVGWAPAVAARPRAAPAPRGPAHPALQPPQPARGGLQAARAAGAASYQTEWEMYRAECNFHQLHVQRTLQIMQQISAEFQGEWHTYGAEAAVARSASHIGTVVRRRALAKEAVVQAPAADTTPIVGDIFDDAMRPGGCWPGAGGGGRWWVRAPAVGGGWTCGARRRPPAARAPLALRLPACVHCRLCSPPCPFPPSPHCLARRRLPPGGGG